MNVLEHFIKEIHSVRDITEEFKQHSGYEPTEPLLQVDLTYDCYGIITRETKTFWKSDFERAKKEGYFGSELARNRNTFPHTSGCGLFPY